MSIKLEIGKTITLAGSPGWKWTVMEPWLVECQPALVGDQDRHASVVADSIKLTARSPGNTTVVAHDQTEIEVYREEVEIPAPPRPKVFVSEPE